MSEREVSTNESDALHLSLTNGRVVTIEDEIEKKIAGKLLESGRENALSSQDIGQSVWGEHYDPSENNAQLVTSLIDLREKLVVSGAQLGISIVEGHNHYWLEGVDVPESVHLDTAIVEKPRPELPAIVSRISDNLWEKITPLDRANLTEAYFRNPSELEAQIDKFLAHVVAFGKGHDETVDVGALLDVSAGEKQALVSKHLRNLLSLSIVNPQDRNIKTVSSWGRQLNDLILLSGGGERGTEVVFSAINGLSDLERAALLSQISMTKRFEIFKVGLDQIDEREMAYFISISAFEFGRSGDAGDLEEIILTSVERDIPKEQFSCTKVVQAIFDHYPDRAALIFRRLTEAAQQLDFEHHLMSFFESHPETSNMACAIEDEDSEQIDKIVPWNRRL